jgi:solute carrier family 35 protein F1/2
MEVHVSIAVGMYALFAVCMFALYTLIAVVISRASATLYNLSILTVNVYSLAIGVFVFEYKVRIMHCLTW